MAHEIDNAKVYFPPPVIYLSGAGLGGLISWFCHVQIMPNIFARTIGILFIAIGLGVIITAKIMMKKADTDIKPWKPTTAILRDGIYSVSRNPIYVAMTFIYFGIALVVNSVWMFPPVVLVLLAINFYVIAREEKYLESKFGEEYINYKKEVRRWI